MFREVDTCIIDYNVNINNFIRGFVKNFYSDDVKKKLQTTKDKIQGSRNF